MASNSKMLVLRSYEGDEFNVEESLASAGSGTLKTMVDEGIVEGGIPLPNVSTKSLGKIIEYWRHHAQEDSDGSPESKAAMKEWDDEFLKLDGNKKELLNLVMAANYLDAKPLFEALCEEVRNTIKVMSVEEVRSYLNIENDFTPEEEEKIRAENAWAFENN
uniref:SKP1-like protein n=1 Tax=Lilium longiflorum TaxID=4690 RepID=C7SJ59_LILLO|nr:pollen specific SKP1-like protein LSK1 [Lilium longiflorum]